MALVVPVFFPIDIPVAKASDRALHCRCVTGLLFTLRAQEMIATIMLTLKGVRIQDLVAATATLECLIRNIRVGAASHVGGFSFPVRWGRPGWPDTCGCCGTRSRASTRCRLRRGCGDGRIPTGR